jgi:Ca2+:H+ antiporter
MIGKTPWWAWTWPALAWLLLAATSVVGSEGLVTIPAAAALIATVYAAVYHAEVVAHRTGEPFGTLVLAVAVTVIEVALRRNERRGSHATRCSRP